MSWVYCFFAFAGLAFVSVDLFRSERCLSWESNVLVHLNELFHLKRCSLLWIFNYSDHVFNNIIDFVYTVRWRFIIIIPTVTVGWCYRTQPNEQTYRPAYDFRLYDNICTYSNFPHCFHRRFDVFVCVCAANIFTDFSPELLQWQLKQKVEWNKKQQHLYRNEINNDGEKKRRSQRSNGFCCRQNIDVLLFSLTVTIYDVK